MRVYYEDTPFGGGYLDAGMHLCRINPAGAQCTMQHYFLDAWINFL